MNPEVELVQVGALVPREMAEQVKVLAQKRERSAAAEIRLALKAWIELAAESEAA